MFLTMSETRNGGWRCRLFELLNFIFIIFKTQGLRYCFCLTIIMDLAFTAVCKIHNTFRFLFFHANKELKLQQMIKGMLLVLSAGVVVPGQADFELSWKRLVKDSQTEKPTAMKGVRAISIEMVSGTIFYCYSHICLFEAEKFWTRILLRMFLTKLMKV